MHHVKRNNKFISFFCILFFFLNLGSIKSKESVKMAREAVRINVYDMTSLNMNAYMGSFGIGGFNLRSEILKFS